MATMSTVWDRAAEFLGDNLAALAPVVVLALFVPLCLFGILMPLIGSADSGAGVLLSVLLLALSVVTVWGGLAITALALDPAEGRKPAMSAATQRLLPVLGIGLVMLLVVIILMLPFGVALGLSGLDMAAMAGGGSAKVSSDFGAALFFVLYLPVFALILLWLSARVALINPVIIMERRGLGAVARSFTLTARVQWKLIGVILLYFLVSQVAAYAARTVFGSVLAFTIGGDGPLNAASVLTAIIVAGVSTVFSVLAIAFTARLYLAARDARELIVEGAIVDGVRSKRSVPGA